MGRKDWRNFCSVERDIVQQIVVEWVIDRLDALVGNRRLIELWLQQSSTAITYACVISCYDEKIEVFFSYRSISFICYSEA